MVRIAFLFESLLNSHCQIALWGREIAGQNFELPGYHACAGPGWRAASPVAVNDPGAIIKSRLVALSQDDFVRLTYLMDALGADPMHITANGADATCYGWSGQSTRWDADD